MSTIEQLKAEAAALQSKVQSGGQPLKHSAALEQIARGHGYANWRACVASLSTRPGKEQSQQRATHETEMKRFVSREWNFSLDIPARWNSFPAVPTNSPFEVIRFGSRENGSHWLIVFRHPYDPQESPETTVKNAQQTLETQGFVKFGAGKTRIGPRVVRTLDFERPLDNGGTWSCREYFVIEETLMHVLGFGTSGREAMFDLYHRMAKSFSLEQPWAPSEG